MSTLPILTCVPRTPRPVAPMPQMEPVLPAVPDLPVLPVLPELTEKEETPQIQRARRHLLRLHNQWEDLQRQLTERQKKEAAIQCYAEIQRFAPGWKLATIIGGLRAAFDESQEDPHYFAEITQYGTDLLQNNDAGLSHPKPSGD